jgi:hypothetical protein
LNLSHIFIQWNAYFSCTMYIKRVYTSGVHFLSRSLTRLKSIGRSRGVGSFRLEISPPPFKPNLMVEPPLKKSLDPPMKSKLQFITSKLRCLCYNSLHQSCYVYVTIHYIKVAMSICYNSLHQTFT